MSRLITALARVTAACLLTAGLAAATGPSVGAATGTPEPPPTVDDWSAGGFYAPLSAFEQYGVHPDYEDEIGTQAESGTITAGSCQYRQANDYPHISSTSPRATSIHGWWRQMGGVCPLTANVDQYLQAVLCTPSGCGWVTVASSSATVRPGGGSGKWATARVSCSTLATVGYRGYTDVDLTGVDDPSGYTYSSERNLSCYPAR